MASDITKSWKLILLFPVYPFSNPWKHHKTVKVFWCFQGLQKVCIRNKWVNTLLFQWKHVSYIKHSCIKIDYTFVLNNTIWGMTRFRSIHQRCSVKKGILRNFAKFTGKHLCQSLFFNKVAGEHVWATASYIYGKPNLSIKRNLVQTS